MFKRFSSLTIFQNIQTLWFGNFVGKIMSDIYELKLTDRNRGMHDLF